MDEKEAARIHQEILDLAKSNQHRIEGLEEEQKELRNLTNAVASLATEQKNIRTDLSEMKTDIKAIKEKPGKRWDNTVEKICTLVIAAVVAWMLGQIGL